MQKVLTALGWVGCALVAVAASQTTAPPPQRPPVFRAGTDLVQLDISVLDRNRQAVRGLRETDFSVLEDGKPQPIVAFEAIDLPDVVETSSTWMKEVTPDVTTNEVQDSRLWVMVIDDAVAHFDANVLKNMKTIVRGVVERMPPTDLMAVVFTRDNRHTQDFTGDRAKLLAAVETFTFGFPNAPDSDGGYYWRSSIKTITAAGEYLIAAPSRRKSLVYVGVGVPVVQTSPLQVMSILRDELTRSLTNAKLAGVNVYTIDACGLRVEPMPGDRDPCKLGLPEVDYMLTLSANTGGRSILNTNEFEPGIQSIFRENNSYYLLGYRPVNARQDGTYRRIEVRVNRPGVEIRTRNGYYAEDAKKTAERLAKTGEPSPVTKALSAILPTPDLPAEVTVAPFAVPGKRESAVLITLGLRPRIPISTSAVPARINETIDLETRAFTPEGAARGVSRQTASVAFRPGSTGEAPLEILARIDLKPGRYSLRLGAHSRATSTTGTVYTDVDVPDFAALPLVFSGVVMSASPGRFAAPKAALAPIIPLVPTAERAFQVNQTVAAFLRLYQGGKAPARPVEVSIRITDGHDVAVSDERRTLTPADFGAARTVDLNFPVPLSRLNRGPHLVTFMAVAGYDSARRDVRFTVR